jgi:hypothetical protein
MAEHPDLGRALRQEAERHVPDRDAILNRVARRRGEPAPGRWAFLALRPVAAAASVVATLVLGVAGVRLIDDRDPGPDDVTAATGTSAPASAPTAPPAAPPAAPPSSADPSAESPSSAEPPDTTTGEPPVTATTGPRPTDPGGPAGPPDGPRWTPAAGFLRSAAEIDAHSNETWAQGNLVLTTTEPITSLDVLVSVARTDGVANAGQWSSIPAEMMTMAVTEEKSTLLYRFTLHDGQSLAPGDYTFAAQYLHATGKRDAAADTYGAIALAGDSRAEVVGPFSGS